MNVSKTAQKFLVCAAAGILSVGVVATSSAAKTKTAPAADIVSAAAKSPAGTKRTLVENSAAITVPGIPACYSVKKLKAFTDALYRHATDAELEKMLGVDKCMILSAERRVTYVRQIFKKDAPAGAREFTFKGKTYWTIERGLKPAEDTLVTNETPADLDAVYNLALPEVQIDELRKLNEPDATPALEELMSAKIDTLTVTNGTLTRPDGVIAVGEFRNGALINGTITFADGMTVTGVFTSESDGRGEIKYPDGRVAKGTFSNWKLNGKDGTLVVPGKYVATGSFQNGALNGDGKIVFENKLTLEGRFTNNQLSGRGKITFPDKSVATGFFVRNKLSGKGEIRRASGAVSSGLFKNNKLNGEGQIKTADAIVSGTFVNDKLNGEGTIKYSSGTILSGTFKDGKLNGKGSITYASRVKIEGTFKNNILSGVAKKTYPDGTVFIGQIKDVDLNSSPKPRS